MEELEKDTQEIVKLLTVIVAQRCKLDPIISQKQHPADALHQVKSLATQLD